MTTARRDSVARDLRTLFREGPLGALADGALVERFLARRGESGALAFEVLVRRHGPMVWRVCREALRDRHDAEDAFQATFLVLARRAGSIRRRDSVGPWLHGVALRVSGHARLCSALRRRHERSAAAPEAVAGPDPDRGESARLLREEVDRLPEKYRAPIVLCHLEGLSQDEAARQLGWLLGTVRSRLARGRDRLRTRLTRRGLAPALLILGAAPSRAEPPASLIQATVGAAPGSGGYAPAIAVLIERTLRAMPISRLRSALVGPLALAAVLMVCSNRPAAPQYPPAPDRTSEPVTKPSDRGGAPELVAPRSLSAHFSAGTARVFALDWNGHRIEIKEERGAEEKLIDAELRAVAVVGLLDHGSIRVNYAKALGIGLDRAHPQYLRVELERQNRTPEGDWSPWRPIDPRANRLVIENITEQEEDLAPPETRLDPLVDMIPFLRKGHWKGIHLLDLNPKDDRVDRLHVRDDRAPGRTEAPVLLVRQFDFTAEPGRTYRYRARVVADPSAPRDDRPRELAGPWSEPTRAVTVPPEDAKPEEQPKRVQP